MSRQKHWLRSNKTTISYHRGVVSCGAYPERYARVSLKTLFTEVNREAQLAPRLQLLHQPMHKRIPLEFLISLHYDLFCIVHRRNPRVPLKVSENGSTGTRWWRYRESSSPTKVGSHEDSFR